MDVDKKLFNEIAKKVESDMECSGLTDSIYEDFAFKVLEPYLLVKCDQEIPPAHLE